MVKSISWICHTASIVPCIPMSARQVLQLCTFGKRALWCTPRGIHVLHGCVVNLNGFAVRNIVYFYITSVVVSLPLINCQRERSLKTRVNTLWGYFTVADPEGVHRFHGTPLLKGCLRKYSHWSHALQLHSTNNARVHVSLINKFCPTRA